MSDEVLLMVVGLVLMAFGGSMVTRTPMWTRLFGYQGLIERLEKERRRPSPAERFALGYNQPKRVRIVGMIWFGLGVAAVLVGLARVTAG